MTQNSNTPILHHSRFVIVFVAFLALGGELRAQALIKVPFPYSPINTSALPFMMAKDLKLFEKHGLDVDLIFMGASSLIIQSMLSGAANVAGFGGPAIISNVVRGGDIIAVAATVPLAQPTDKLSGFTVTLHANEKQTILGEPISLTIRGTNSSTVPIEIPGPIDVLGGTLTVRIAFENGPYRQYIGPLWHMRGVKVLKPPTLAPGATIETTATVLHHRAPKRGSLNETTWKRITDDEIDTEIALPKPGRYRLKAILFGAIESPPLEIQVSEPQAFDDIEMWKFISVNPEYAYFMQSGEFLLPGKVPGKWAIEMTDDLEKFINYYANSKYTPYFRQAIGKQRQTYELIQKSGRLKD